MTNKKSREHGMGSFFLSGSFGSGKKVASRMECVIMDAVRPFLSLSWVSSFLL
jgi:hypothetical protein